LTATLRTLDDLASPRISSFDRHAGDRDSSSSGHPVADGLGGTRRTRRTSGRRAADPESRRAPHRRPGTSCRGMQRCGPHAGGIAVTGPRRAAD
jgi:hypothetical protein